MSARGPKPGIGAKVSVSNAREAWGVSIPDWVMALAEACDRSSQNSVAKRLGYSGATISGVIKNKYRGDIERVEQAVRGSLMSETVMCPVLGDLRRDRCLINQKKAKNPNPTSSVSMRLAKACKHTCPHSRLVKDSDDA